MSEEAAVKLGQEVLDKTYEPSSMAQCEPSLTLDRNPHAVQFTQFILFAKPRQSIRSPEPPEYLILQQAKPRGSNGRHPMIEALIKPLSRRLSGEVLKSDDRSQPAPETERLPDPDNPRTDVGRLRAFAAEHRIPGYAAGWT
ncbi:MAG: hypothetical protein HYS69_17440, partial [candidate division NC10 bacterium]|nr:hypothetical protein [candidate division NC10 bacterium]